ncbi:9796_t:CDS:2, partial [Ambispora leptoticha]
KNNSLPKETMSKIVQLYVIRRKLEGTPFRLRKMAHSAVLVGTANNVYYIIELVKQKEKSNVVVAIPTSFYVISTDYNNPHQVINMNGEVWTKQLYGKHVYKDVTVEEARQYLQNEMNQYPYDLLEWNCHVAQETLRKWLGVL